jgi:hypothetical protein
VPDNDGTDFLKPLNPAEDAGEAQGCDAEPSTGLLPGWRPGEIALAADIPPAKRVLRAVGPRIVRIHEEIAWLRDMYR